jgi:hypothetical protein
VLESIDLRVDLPYNIVNRVKKDKLYPIVVYFDRHLEILLSSAGCFIYHYVNVSLQGSLICEPESGSTRFFNANYTPTHNLLQVRTR